MNEEICGAKARSNEHQPCQLPAMKNGRCRFHGGLSTGAKTPEGKQQQKLAGKTSSWKHGYYSAEAIKERSSVRQMQQESRDLLLLSKNSPS